MAINDLRTQVKDLQSATDAARVAIATHVSSTGQPPTDAAVQQVQTLASQLQGAKAALDTSLLAVPSNRPPGAAPASILQLQYQNPSLGGVDQSKDFWTAMLVGDVPFPNSNGSALEWVPVLDPQEEYGEYDVPMTAASGWIIDPNFSGGDVPFTHPFGFDWECELAVDTPASGPSGPGTGNDYSYLVAVANRNDHRDSDATVSVTSVAEGLGIPVAPNGLLGIEIERGIVPDDFTTNVAEGDRFAVLGRWIVDAGHWFLTDPTDPSSAPLWYRTEIHPPMLMASAGLRVINDLTVTQAMITSRPFFTGQQFIVDDEEVYQDSAPSDGYLYDHMHSEVTKVVEFESNQVEAHPRILSKPFTGISLFGLRIAPPPQPARRLGLGITNWHLSISYHFTVRGECNVQVTSDGQSVQVMIALNDAQWPQVPLPFNDTKSWTKDELSALNSTAGPGFENAETTAEEDAALLGALFGGVVGSAAGVLHANRVLEMGVLTDQYSGVEFDADLRLPGRGEQRRAARHRGRRRGHAGRYTAVPGPRLGRSGLGHPDRGLRDPGGADPRQCLGELRAPIGPSLTNKE